MTKNNQSALTQNLAQSVATQPPKRSYVKKLHLPADPIGKRYVARFFHPFGAIVADVPAQGIEAKPEWRTCQHFMQPSILWQLHQNEKSLIGIRFGSQTSYATIDLDVGGDYHSLESVSRIKGALENIGIVSLVPCQSSSSGGLHLILPFPEPLPTFAVACALDQTLRNVGFIPRPGHLEIFPNPKSYSKEKATNYKAVRCPLQPGSKSFLLDDDLLPISSDVVRFLDYCDHAAARQDIEQLKRVINQARKRHKPQHTNIQNTDVNVWHSNWEEIITTGWTGSGQTNTIIQTIVGYGIVFLGLKGQELVDYAVNAATNAPGYREYCRHQHEIQARVQDWVDCNRKNKYYSAYASCPDRLLSTYSASFASAIAGGTHVSNKNNIVKLDRRKEINWQRSLEAQNRIQTVVRGLELSATFPEGTTNRTKAICAEYKRRFHKSLSQETLHKYLYLWHPKWYISDPWVENALLNGENAQNPYQIDEYGHCDNLHNPSALEKTAQNSCQISEYGHFPLMKVFRPALPLKASAPQGQEALSSKRVADSVADSPNQQSLQTIFYSEVISNTSTISSRDNDLLTTSVVSNSEHTQITNSHSIVHSDSENSDLLVFSKSNEINNKICSHKQSKYPPNCSTPRKVHKQNLSIASNSIPHNTSATTPPEALLNASDKQPEGSPTDVSSNKIEEVKKTTRLRLQAKIHAQKIVTRYGLMTGQFLRGAERSHLEQIVKMQFYLDSGHPPLIEEANSWAADHPGCLPFDLESAFNARANE